MNETGTGWRSLPSARRTKASGSPTTGPTSGFIRLARVQVLSAAGDAMIAVALAGSLFFSIDPSAARWRVGLYLAFTVAPFAIVGPLIGPLLDRTKGGRRRMMTAVNAIRTVAALLMISNIDTLFLFPLMFASLVGGKSFAIGRAALVPTVVRDASELVNTNSRLSLLTGLSGMAGAVPAALASVLFGPAGAVSLAMVTFGAATIASLRLPSTPVATTPADSTERLELRGTGIRLAGSAMGILRGIVGYLTFLVAFAFRGGADNVDLSGVGTAFGSAAYQSFDFPVGSDSSVPAWQLGVVIGFNVMGMLSGALLAPRVRRSTPEENILLGALVMLAAVGLFGAWSGDLTAAALVSFAVGLAASAGKLSFDSIVQRDAPDANYGRSFARFETRFQVYWVIGALLPVVITTPAGLGFFAIAIAAAVAAVTYFLGSRSSSPPTPAASTKAPFDDLADDLRPSYPTMNLRSPKRMPTGWTESRTPNKPEPTRPGSTPKPADKTPTAVDQTNVEIDPTTADAVETDHQLPLWD